MRTSEQVDKITAALLSFQKQITPPTKNKDNPYFKSKYADLSSLLDHCKPAMQANGLVFTSVGLTSRIMHSSGQWIEGDFPVEVHGLDAQKVGSAFTYGRRYNFQGLLGINAEEDDDGAQASNKPQAAAPRSTSKPAAEPKLQTRKLAPNESKLHPPAESDGDRVPAEVTDAAVPAADDLAAASDVKIVTLEACTKERTDKKEQLNRGLKLICPDGSAEWWQCYEKASMDLAAMGKGKRFYAKLEDKNGFKLCHNLTPVSA